jgi:nucleoid-associated protein YgaU
VNWLRQANPQIENPRSLKVGSVIKIPARPSPRSTTARPRPSETPRASRTYRVKAGDSFYRIARDVLGDASRWKELFELNKDLVKGDPKRLQVDQVIVLPHP